MYTVKQLVSKGNIVQFVKYLDGNLYYTVLTPIDVNDFGEMLFKPTNFIFPVPISDIGNATFLAQDKAILFMRYIRKHLDLTSNLDF